MTRVFKDDGRVIPVTVIECSPNEITQIKTVDKDGYPALVLGFSKLRKPTKTKKFSFSREFKIDEKDIANYKVGDTLTLEALKDLEKVTITGVSKGKGFQGVVKKYHFRGGARTHGSHMHREPGSVGTRAKPGRVHKGKKLPGEMGNQTVTLQGVSIEMVDVAKNIICLKGQIPGPKSGLVIIKKQ